MLEGKKPPNIYYQMETLSREYGWTPEQIRQQGAEDIKQYHKIIRTRRILENKKLKQK